MKETNLYHAKNEKAMTLVIICAIIPLLWFMLPYALNAAAEFIVTDCRIRIKKVSGSWTELPMDSIGMISRTFWLGKLIMKTSSGFIAVWGFAERDKVFELISQKIIARQAENTASAQPELPEI